MIQKLRINNFKSIEELDFDCKKLNVFIGEPNSGKSNIIEALSLQSQDGVTPKELNRVIFRYKAIRDLFYDFNINKPIEVYSDQLKTRLEYAISNTGVAVNQFYFHLDYNSEKEKTAAISHSGDVQGAIQQGKTNVRFYEFENLTSFLNTYSGHISVPNGANLPELLISNEDYNNWVEEFLNSHNLKLTLDPVENKISISKLIGNKIYSYPYFALSETLQRIIFYTLVIKSNKDSVILLDEPDSNTFPFYTKDFAEKIALDESNQYFVTTHNPYLLFSIIEKAKEEDLNVFITQMKDYKTTLSKLSSDQISEVLDLDTDVFFNFDKILDL